MTVRDLEVRLTRLEDSLLGRLGYREYVVNIGTTVLDPVPEVTMKPISGYSENQLRSFIDNMGGRGNPIGYYQLAISRLIDETLIRSYEYWTLTRDTYVATCVPVELQVDDSRYQVTLAVIKQSQ